jgi:hypothetical protein
MLLALAKVAGAAAIKPEKSRDHFFGKRPVLDESKFTYTKSCADGTLRILEQFCDIDAATVIAHNARYNAKNLPGGSLKREAPDNTSRDGPGERLACHGTKAQILTDHAGAVVMLGSPTAFEVMVAAFE